jgi:type IV fimbrial biogenesis protein FimT
MKRCAGLTLVELIVCMAVLAVLATLTVPAFGDLRLDAARTTAVNDFFHALFLARSEAIKRGQVVSLCRSRDGEYCATNEAPWSVGWIVFVNLDRDEPAERDDDEPVIAVYGPYREGTITSNRATYSFRPVVQGVVNGTVVFCDRRGSEHARAIIISHTGRPRVARRDSSGKPLACQAESGGTK